MRQRNFSVLHLLYCMNFFTMSLYHFLIKRYSELKTCKRSCWNRPFESLWYVTFNWLEFWSGLKHLFRSLQPGGQRDIIREYHGPRLSQSLVLLIGAKQAQICLQSPVPQPRDCCPPSCSYYYPSLFSFPEDPGTISPASARPRVTLKLPTQTPLCFWGRGLNS